MPEGEGAPTSMEERLNTISSKLSELDDLLLVNKLDLINLKNEIEKLKLTASIPGPEVLERVSELGKVVENAEEFRKLKALTKNIDKIMADIQAVSPGGLEDMIKVVDDIDKRVKRLETQGLGMRPREAEEYAKSVEELRSSIERLPKGARVALDVSKQIEKLRLMVEENTKNIWKLMKEKPTAKPEGTAKRAVVKEAEAVRCPRCKTVLPPHAKFCRRCGTGIK